MTELQQISKELACSSPHEMQAIHNRVSWRIAWVFLGKKMGVGDTGPFVQVNIHILIRVMHEGAVNHQQQQLLSQGMSSERHSSSGWNTWELQNLEVYLKTWRIWQPKLSNSPDQRGCESSCPGQWQS
jgi:hypothetical protein